MATVTEVFTSRELRDERWSQLRRDKVKGVVRYTSQQQDQVRLANGKMVKGEMVWLVSRPT